MITALIYNEAVWLVPSLLYYIGLYFYQNIKLVSLSERAPVNFVSLMLMIIIFVRKSAFY